MPNARATKNISKGTKYYRTQRPKDHPHWNFFLHPNIAMGILYTKSMRSIKIKTHTTICV